MAESSSVGGDFGDEDDWCWEADCGVVDDEEDDDDDDTGGGWMGGIIGGDLKTEGAEAVKAGSMIAERMAWSNSW